MFSSASDLPTPQSFRDLTPNRYVLKVIRLHPLLLIFSVIASVFTSASGVLIPVALGNGIESIRAQHKNQILIWAGVILILGFAQAFGAGLQKHCANALWNRVIFVVRHDIAVHITRLGSTLRNHTDGAGIIASAGMDAANIARFPNAVGLAIGSVAAFAITSFFLLKSSVLLGVITLIGVPAAILSITPFFRQLLRGERKRRKHLEAVNALTTDIVSGLRILRGIGGEKRFLNRFINANQQLYAQGIELSRSEAWLAAAETTLPSFISIVIVWLGAQLVVAQELSVGELITFYGVSVFLVVPVSAVIQILPTYSSIRIAAEKICDFSSLQPLITEPENPLPLPAGPLELYDSLNDFTAQAGKLTVVDPRSCDAQLSERLGRLSDAAPREQVFIGGIPIHRVALTQLRQRVALARSQDIWFSGTVRDQISSDRSSTVDLKTALEAADAGDIIEAFPDKVEELVGELGRQVSGGQRQRLNLARALALDSDVLILDEPTSAVDAHTESRIVERVKELRSGKTTIVFSESPLWTAEADSVRRVGEK